MQSPNNDQGGELGNNPLYNSKHERPSTVQAVVGDPGDIVTTPSVTQNVGHLKYNTSIPLPSPKDSYKGSETRVATVARKSGFKGWVDAHPRLFRGLIIFGVLGLLTMIIVSSVCMMIGCKPKKDSPAEEIPLSLRLLVRFTSPETSVAELLPLLSKYFNSTKLASSGLEVLQFEEQDVLRRVKGLLKEQYSSILDLLVSDFVMTTGLTVDGLDPVASYSKQPASQADSPPVDPGTEASLGAAGADTTASGSRRRSAQADLDDSQPDPLEAEQWHLAAVNAADAWATTKGVSEVIVAVMDTGFAIDHPDLRGSIWVNRGEIPGNGVDDDGNGFIDDVNGYDFAGPCSTEWRRSIPPPPAPSPPPRPPVPPLRPPAKRGRNLLSMAAPPTPPSARPPSSRPPPRRPPAPPPVQPPRNPPPPSPARPPMPVDRYYVPGRCGSDADPRPDPYDKGHGTHVAGIVAAVRGNKVGGSGLAPRVKIMALKVADPFGNFYASNIMAAYDYAARMGAHVVSNSFGPSAPELYPTQYMKDEAARQNLLYMRAVQPLADKGVLLVAAAGNENTNLDGLRDVDMNYLPCTLDLPNVICVAATQAEGGLWSETVFNRELGTNYGPFTVDMAAPGARILSTVPFGDNVTGAYALKTGSSMATPLVSAAAALVLTILGSDSGNFYQAARVKSIILESGDTQPGLRVITQRTLNAARAVQTAQAFSGSGTYLLTPMSVDVAAKSSATIRSLTDTYYRLSATAASALQADTDKTPLVPSPALNLLGLKPFATSARPATGSLAGFKFNGSDVVVAVRGYLRLPTRGVYGIRIATTVPQARIAVTVGQRLLQFNATGTSGVREAAMQALAAPAWYDFEVLYGNPMEGVELSWSLPSSRNTWGALPDGYLLTGTLTPVIPVQYMPRDLPKMQAAPSSEVPAIAGGFSVIWNVMRLPTLNANTTIRAPADPAGSVIFNPGFLATLSPDNYFPYSAFVDELAFPNSTALTTALAGGAADARQADAGAATAVGAGPVYGIATTYIQTVSNAPISVAFVVTCTQCQLYLDGLLFHETFDTTAVPGSATPPTTTTRITPCVTLDPVTNPALTGVNRTRHVLQIRFAARASAATAGLVLQQGSCAGRAPTSFSPLRPILAPAPWYKAAAAPVSNRNGSIQCDVWDYDVFPQPSYLTLGNIPRRDDLTPVAQFRLPDPRTTTPCLPPGSFCPSGRLFSMRLVDVFSVDTLPKYMYVRCWTWMSRGLGKGLLNVFASDSLSTAVYLGSQQVFRSLGTGDPTPFARQSRAPNSTFMGGNYRQILAVEWHGVTPQSRLAMVEGTVEQDYTAPAAIVIDNTMFAPAA